CSSTPRGLHSFPTRRSSDLGRGGMGTVFQAQHTTLKRVVALKVMAHEFLADEGAVARFQREIQAAAALDDPHIVAAYDAESVGRSEEHTSELQSRENLVCRL